jgi:protein O-mannosyl-transferase
MSPVLVKLKPFAKRDFWQSKNVRRALGVCVFLVVAIVLVFGRTLKHGFLNFDDNYFVVDEPHVSGGLTLSGIVWAFTNGPFGEWYPLSMLSHMLDCQVYGLNPAGHHLTNLLLHAATSIGLFLVLWRMTAGFWPSALVAALFAIHPLHVESVAWIAERRDVLSGLFFVLILGAYDEYVRHPASLSRYLTVFFLLALGLMAKPILITVPALLLLLDYWPLRRFSAESSAGMPTEESRLRPFPWRVLLDKLPLVALSIADALLTMLTHMTHPYPLTWPERLANAANSYVAYLGQLFVPVGLSIFYSHPEVGRPGWQVAAAVVLLLAITSAAVVWRRSLPYVFVGWFWYVGMLIPVLGLTYVGQPARGDRYTYLPQIGLYMALVWGAMRLGAAWPVRRWVFSVGSAVILAALMACAWWQTGYWKDDRALWQRAVACDANSPTAHFFLGFAFDGSDDQIATAEYRQALEIGANDRPIYKEIRAKAHTCLALKQQDPAEAIAHYRQALEWDPTLIAALMNLGVKLADQGDFDEATIYFDKVAATTPRKAAEAYCKLATAQMQQDQTADALMSFHKSLKANDDYAPAHANLTLLLVKRREVNAAIEHCGRAIELDPDLTVPYEYMVRLLRMQQKNREAAVFEERGMQARRRVAESQNARGVKLMRQEKVNDAILQFQSAITLVPDFARAHSNLGDAFAAQGRTEEAAASYRRAQAIKPDSHPAEKDTTD